MEVSQTLSAQHEESQQESHEFHEGNETCGLYEKGRIKDGYKFTIRSMTKLTVVLFVEKLSKVRYRGIF